MNMSKISVQLSRGRLVRAYEVCQLLIEICSLSFGCLDFMVKCANLGLLVIELLSGRFDFGEGCIGVLID